ncbi:hypothetical protein [uncultured Paraglaciecola sp.]|uniref:hypothetical protein n=1 Tax=uncultured Paraglaciecola sp. TaxID=1765024 RepID=UPI0030D7733C|tara:strand:+ start:8059 stop:8544 length:486 start_codon:yes stop_codon:yes gene_type:complete
MTTLSATELLAGGSQQHLVSIPAELLDATSDSGAQQVLLRPLTLNDVQLISKAAKEQGTLSSMLMVQRALVEPSMNIENVAKLPAGLVQFLLKEVNRISGLSLSQDELQNAIKAPLTKAVFVLAKEFGWTPSECAELTVGQVMLYLEMLSADTKGKEEDVA